MPPKPTSRPDRVIVPVKTHQPSCPVSPADRPIVANASAARRPIHPTHVAVTANHARHHVPVKAQS